MATRIDIEITSDRGDGTMTWRAAGAKQPKGVLSGALLPAGASVGDVLRADAEFTVDGPEIISVQQPKGRRKDTVERLEVLGSGKTAEGVTTQLAGKGRGRGGDRGRGRGRDGGRGRGDGGRPGGGGGRGDGGRGRGGDRNRGRGRDRRPALRVKRTHREAWIASLPETRQPIAEQLMHEGLDGVQAALERQNQVAIGEGREALDTAPVMQIAADLAPTLAEHEWRDTAAAAMDNADTIDLGEMRKILLAGDQFVTADDVPALQANMRAKLSSRVDSDQAAWTRDLRQALSDGRVVRALRSSGRPPRAGVPLPADLVDQLSTAAIDALAPEEEANRWSMIVEALAVSPVRRLVTPTEKPEEENDDLLDTVERLAWRVPGVATLFDIEVKPRKRRR